MKLMSHLSCYAINWSSQNFSKFLSHPLSRSGVHFAVINSWLICGNSFI